MAIQDGIYAFLIADAGVSAIVGTRVYPILMPQNPTFELITYQKISGVRGKQLSGTTGYARPVIQIDCWAESFLTAQTLADAVRSAVDGYSGLMGSDVVDRAQIMNEMDLYENETQIFRVSQDYEIWHTE